MIGFLKRWFVPRGEYEHKIDCIYIKHDKQWRTIASLRDEIDQLAAAVQELRKDQLMRRDAELDSWRPVKTATKKTTTKPKAKQ